MAARGWRGTRIYAWAASNSEASNIQLRFGLQIGSAGK